MLTTKREADIRLEEAYRLCVRRELEIAKPDRPFWSLINSPFVLWLLSSVLLASISFAYAKYDEKEKKNGEARAILRKIDAEMAIRLDHLLEVVSDQTVPAMVLREEIMQTWTGHRGSLYSEYQSMGFFSLAVLAQMHASTKEDETEIRSARIAFDNIWLELKKKVDWSDPNQQNAFAAKARPLISLAALPRWRLDSQLAGWGAHR